ncbi:MAG: NAD(P)H-dependent glycerol-3-phosphate dehydrogenase [Chitinivibrionales bacterium]|nr:NAD(P)H-dependent glycerol-3-phosphate dehydrogenase [Chitinivibrionales bacterium]
MRLTILGAGSWGIALAVLLSRRGHVVSMWEFNSDDAAMLNEKREHANKLPGISIPEEIFITDNISQAFADADYVICAVPAQTMRSTMKAIAGSVPRTGISDVRCWIIVSKGIECGSLKLMSEVLAGEISGLSDSRIVVLSGPSHAEEVSRGIPTTVVAASHNRALAEEVQREFSTDSFRVYTNTDVVGVELAAGVKNVIAVAAGICDGLGFGDNTKGAILTRGMVEMVRLGKKMGADERTFSGLAGIGDLITTCMSKHSRNRKIGEMIGKGLSLEQALKNMVMVAEGVETTKSVYELAGKYEIEMPITTEVYRSLFENKSAREAARDLMMREFKPERW